MINKDVQEMTVIILIATAICLPVAKLIYEKTRPEVTSLRAEVIEVVRSRNVFVEDKLIISSGLDRFVVYSGLYVEGDSVSVEVTTFPKGTCDPKVQITGLIGG
jgi:hypothetical protein